MVIAFSDHAVVVSPFTDSIQQLTTAIASIQPTHGQSHVSDSLKLARAYTTNVNPESEGLAASESAQLEIFSDGLIADIEEQALQRGETLRYHMVGSVDDTNVGITTIDAKRPTESSEDVQVFISLLNTQAQDVSVDIELLINGIPSGVQQVLIPAQRNDVPGTSSLVFVPLQLCAIQII